MSAATESIATTSTAPGAHEHVGDLERLLAVVGLGHEQLVDVDADLLGVQRVHRVLGVDEGAHPSQLLRLGEHVVDERRLARGLRAEDLDDASPRHAADAEREIERSAPVEIAETRTWAPSSPMRMTVPLPNSRSIWRERTLQGGVPRLGDLLLIGDGHRLLLGLR